MNNRILQLKTVGSSAIDLAKVIAITINVAHNQIHYWMGPSEDDYFGEQFCDVKELENRYAEVLQLWSSIINETVTPVVEDMSVEDKDPEPEAPKKDSPLRNCSGYNTKSCVHNCEGIDCHGCQFEAPYKYMVDRFARLSNEDKIDFIYQAFKMNVLDKTTFEMVMSTPSVMMGAVVDYTDDEELQEIKEGLVEIKEELTEMAEELEELEEAAKEIESLETDLHNPLSNRIILECDDPYRTLVKTFQVNIFNPKDEAGNTTDWLECEIVEGTPLLMQTESAIYVEPTDKIFKERAVNWLKGLIESIEHNAWME